MPTTRLSLGKRIVFIVLLIFFGLGLGACVLEAAVRVFFPTTDFLWQWDSRTGMKLVPGMHGRSVKRGLFDVAVDVNSVGFRDREHSIDKPSGTKRVVLIGDSFVEAVQVPFEDSISVQLENRLRSSTHGVEVINLGVSGTGTARQYLTLREYGLQYKPDLILLFFVGNDISDNSRRLQGRSYVPYPVTTVDGKLVRDETGQPTFTPFTNEPSRLAPFADLVKNRWKSYRFFRETMDNSPAINRIASVFNSGGAQSDAVSAPEGDNFGFYEIYRPEQKLVWNEAWQVTEQLLLCVRDLAESNGAKFGVVLVPAAWEVYPALWEEILTQLPTMRNVGLDLDQPSGRLTGFLAEHGVAVLNLLPQFRTRATSSSALYLRSDGHWTSEGHRLAADLVARQAQQILATERSNRAN